MFARGAINAVDARVIGPELAPGIRDDWTLRLRIASALAGLMSDSRKLAALKLEAGSEDPATGTFTVTSRFNPSEETALSFCVHEIGRVMRLERHTARESAGRLPTLNADVLRLVVPRETLMWLGVIERPDGETVLTALKAAVTYAAGQTEAERLVLKPQPAVANGRSTVARPRPQDERAKVRFFAALHPSIVPNSARGSTTDTGVSTAETRPSCGPTTASHFAGPRASPPLQPPPTTSGSFETSPTNPTLRPKSSLPTDSRWPMKRAIRSGSRTRTAWRARARGCASPTATCWLRTPAERPRTPGRIPSHALSRTL